MATSSLIRTKFRFPPKYSPNLFTRPFTSTPEPEPTPKSEPTPRAAFKPKFINTKDKDSDPNHHSFVLPVDTKDPKYILNLYHEVRAKGLIQNDVKVFDETPNRRIKLTKHALELFAKDNGQLPDEFPHIAVVEAYANAGQNSKQAHKVYLRMLAPGVIPNAYTYSVLINSFATIDDSNMQGKAMRYLLEMLGKGMRPDAATCVAVFEPFARKERMKEAKDTLQVMKAKGFIMDEKDVVGILRKKAKKQEALVKTLVEIFFGKKL